MSDTKSPNSSSNWADAIGTLADGGLPQVIAGPAGKALSRLIAGAADIPAAWLEKQAQAIRDQTDARSVIVKSIADAAAAKAASQPEVLDRAISRLASDLYRKQENREEVARIAAEQLRLDPPPLDTDGPTDDWMNLFERYAEDASSEDFRSIWGKILSGEIRRRGSYSAKTLHSVSMLDADLATTVEMALKYCLQDVIPSTLVSRALTFDQSFALQEFGFISQHGQFGSSFNIKTKGGVGHVFTEKFVYQVRSPVDLNLSCYVLTRVGQEIASTLRIEIDDPSEIAGSLWSAFPVPKEVKFAQVLSREGDKYKVGPWQDVPMPPPENHSRN